MNFQKQCWVNWVSLLEKKNWVTNSSHNTNSIWKWLKTEMWKANEHRLEEFVKTDLYDFWAEKDFLNWTLKASPKDLTEIFEYPQDESAF